METENRVNRIFRLFREHAVSLGYTEKVYGDYAYRDPRRRRESYIKMWSARNDKIQIGRDGVSRYEISQ